MLRLPKLFNKLFKISEEITKEAIEEKSQELVSLNNIIPMPKREDYKDNQSKLDLIDFYKNEYLKEIKQNRTITTIDLMPEYLHEFKNMYLDLLLNLCVEDYTDVTFEQINDPETEDKEYFNAQITYIKLKLYQNEIVTLEEQTRLRLIALNEIAQSLSNGKLFTKIKYREIINAVSEEINNLHNTLFMFYCQKIAMQNEAQKYLMDAKTIKCPDEDTDYENFINKRLKDLKDLMEAVDEQELERLENLNISPKLLIAVIEQELEIYVYKNKEKLNEIEQKLRNLETQVNQTIMVDYMEGEDVFDQEKNHYLKLLLELEQFYKIFSKYGRNLVSKEQLKSLYEIKFTILTHDILYDREFDILSNITHTELECYQDIVFRKIESILKGENKHVQNLLLENPKVNVIQDIMNVIKNGENEFIVFNILSNRKILAFLLSFDYNRGLTPFFHEIKCQKSEYPTVDYYDECFEWEDTLSLETIFRIKKCNIEVDPQNDMADDHLYRLYTMCSNESKETSSYALPEGLSAIKIPIGYERNKKLSQVVDYIKKKAYMKIIVMPSSLKSISGNLFYKMKIGTIVLNDGLKELGEYALLIPELTELVFYDTITDVSYNALVFSQLKKITIITSLDPGALHNLSRILINCYKIVQTNRIKYHLASEQNKTKQKLYEEGRYSSIDNSFLYDNDTIYRVYRLIPTFDELVIINENDDKIVFSKERLSFKIERNIADNQMTGQYEEGKLSSFETGMVISKLARTIHSAFNPSSKELTYTKKEY